MEGYVMEVASFPGSPASDKSCAEAWERGYDGGVCVIEGCVWRGNVCIFSPSLDT